MDSALHTAFQASVIRPFFWVDIDLPSGNVRLLDGSATFTIGGEVFSGKHADCGALAGVGTIENGIASEESGQTIALHGFNLDGLADLLAGFGSRVTTGIGLVNIQRGAVIGVDTAFVGELETIDEAVSPDAHTLTLNCASIFVRLLRMNEGHRLNSPYHEQAWPGELGLEYTQGLRNVQTQPGVFLGSERVSGYQMRPSEREA